MSATSQASGSASDSTPSPSSSAPAVSSAQPPPPPPSSSDPASASSLPTSDSASASSVSSSSSSSAPSSPSSAPPTSVAPTSTSSSAPLSTSRSVVLSTGSDGNVFTSTVTQISTKTGAAATPSGSESVRAGSKGFLQNKGAVAAVFTIVGLVAAGIIFMLITGTLRRRRAKRFDREIAEEAKRAPAPVFVDDDDDYNNGYSSAAYAGGGSGGYSDHQHQYGAGEHDQYGGYGGAAAGGGATSEGYPASDAVHSGTGPGGTPSNYMYPSGYSDLGFSDVSSHGTYSQPPMDAYGHNNAHGGAYGAGVGAAGAYEMMGYGHAQQGQVGSDWHAQGGQGGQPQGGYVYPGEEHQQHAQYPPAPTTTTTNSSGSDVLGRSKSGARSLVDSYNTPPVSDGASSGKGVQQPQYADGYVSQYQSHVVDHDGGAYGGMESHHGHVGDVDDDDASDYGDEGDGRWKVLKVANE